MTEMIDQTRQKPTCQCGREATKGRHCEPCLQAELEWNNVPQEDLEAAASHYDRVVQKTQEAGEQQGK